jgi:hypothetical protein
MNRLPVGDGGRHERVFRRHDARLVEEDDVRNEAAVGQGDVVGHGRVVDLRLQRLEGDEVRVETTTTDLVAARTRKTRVTATVEQRRREEERPPDHRGDFGFGASVTMSDASIETSFAPVHVIFAPTEAAESSMCRTSRIFGTFSSTVTPGARSAAAIAGSASFLLPDGRTTPERRRPPSR